MDARFYNSEEIDVERLASDLVNAYLAQGFRAQQVGNKDQMLVQLKKGGDFEAIIGMQAALSLTLQRTAGGVLAMIGQQRWLDKAAVGAVGLAIIPVLWPLAVTAGVGALRQASLGNQVLNMVDGLVRQQRPNVQIGPIPSQIVPQIQQQWAPSPYAQTPVYIPPPQTVNALPAPAPLPQPVVTASTPTVTQLRCPHCNTPYEPGDTFCTGCGRALTTPRMYCSNCNSEVKPGVAFCPKCGASTFQAAPAPQQPLSRPAPAPNPATYTSQSAQTPVYTPPVEPPAPPVYTPPKPATPVYTPPAQPAPPPAPVYTPPTTATPINPPTPQVYYVPSEQQTADPYSAPTIASQPAAPEQPTEPYYVPPVTQEPTIKPQPKVTIAPNTQRQEPPPPQKPRPQKQYYVPSNQAAQEQLEQITQQQADQPTMPASPAVSQQAKSITPRPVSQPASAANAPWGSLIFSDEQQVQLSGERAVVGRYDHDLGGIQPEVDLSKMQGSDTVSRVHASLEHVGSSYILTDLNSTNATRVNGKRLDPDKPTPVNDGDTLHFGKVTSTFKKL